MDPDPYAAPSTSSDDIQSAYSDIEAVRLDHLNHENSIKVIGTLWILGGVLLIVASVAIALTESVVTSFTLAVPITGIGAGSIFLGHSLRKLASWSRIPAAAFAGIGLLAFPIGTLINALVLYYLLSKKGATVFSPEYKDIIAETPGVKIRTSRIAWLSLAVFLLLITFSVIFLMA